MIRRAAVRRTARAVLIGLLVAAGAFIVTIGFLTLYTTPPN